MATFTLHTLGCGSAKPTPRHNPSCTVLDIRERLFMIDCGEGAQKEMQRQRLRMNRLNHIFLTHLHGDHCLGLPGLLGTLGLMGCEGEVSVHTFGHGIKILKRITDFFCGNLPYTLRFNEIDCTEAIVLETDALTIRTIPLEHRVPTVGYIFEEKPKPRHLIKEMLDFHQVPLSQRQFIKSGADFIKEDGTVIPNSMLTRDADPSLSYAHISDTSYMPGLADKIRGVDLLFHETTYLDENRAEAALRGHSTAKEAAMVARDAGAKALLTGHYSSRYKDEDLFRKEAEQIFGNVILNREGTEIRIDRLSFPQ